MTTVGFFRASLVAPIVIPLVLLPFGINAFVGLLLFSLAFGGIQYVLFAAVLFYWVGRLRDPKKIRRLSYVAPLLFIPVQSAGWFIYSGEADPLLGFAVYTIAIGYAYVVLVNVLYMSISRIMRDNSNEP